MDERISTAIEEPQSPSSDPASTPPVTTSHQLKLVELLIEFKNLQNPNHAPDGVFVMPSPESIRTWHAVMFIHSGYYSGGIFRFCLTISDDYPIVRPTVRFTTDMFHPLIDQQGIFHIDSLYGAQTHLRIGHILHHIRHSFREKGLDALQEDRVPNAPALFMYRNEQALFAKLSTQCAALSSSESILYDQSEGPIQFTKFSEGKMEEMKRLALESGARLGRGRSGGDSSGFGAEKTRVKS